MSSRYFYSRKIKALNNDIDYMHMLKSGSKYEQYQAFEYFTKVIYCNGLDCSVNDYIDTLLSYIIKG